MPYQVLARKYRPLRFADVAGQDHVTRTLQNALEQGRVAHGYIFSGHRGIGKTTIARILASALNCQRAIGSPERPTPEPCLQCDSCREIRSGNAVDVIEIDAATNRGIDEIRELRDAARYSPARDRFKIIILDEAHQITDAAFNALLKTLEEPPEHIVFMMATTEPENIPQTIRSRCQHFSFHAVKLDDILGQLRKIAVDENILADGAALDLLAEAGDGSMRDALSIMDQAIASAPVVDGKPQLSASEIRDLMGSVPNTVFEEILEHVSANQAAGVLTTANRLLDAGNSPAQIARQFVRYLRNCVVAKIAHLTPDSPDTELLQISPDERRRAARSSLLFTEEELTRFLQVMLRTFDDLGFRQEQRFHLELGLLKLVHLQRLLPMEHFLSQLPRPDSTRRIATPPPPTARPSAPLQSAAATPSASTAESLTTPAVGPQQRIAAPLHPAATPPQTADVLSRPAATPPQARSTDASFRPERSAVEKPASLSAEPVTPAPAAQAAAATVPSSASSSQMESVLVADGADKPAPPAAESPATSAIPPTPDPAIFVEDPPQIQAPGPSAKTTESTDAGFSAQPTLSPANPKRTEASTPAITANPFGPKSASQLANPQPSNVPALARPNSVTEPEPSTGIDAHLPPIDAYELDAIAASAEDDNTPPPPAPDPEAQPTPENTGDAAPLQAAAVEALFATGTQNSAAEQLEETTWTVVNGEVRVQTSLSKPMMHTIFRPETQAIVRSAITAKGAAGLKLTFLPGNVADKPKAARKPRTGSAQARALEHPTVQAAQRLFNAEVTNVFDLRKD